MIKLVIGKTVKATKLKEPTLQQIRQIVKSFPNAPIDYTLTYVDADGDQICINSDQELSLMLTMGLKKIFVKESLSESIDMATLMTEKINLVFDEPQKEVKKEQEKAIKPQLPSISNAEEIPKPPIKWYLNQEEPMNIKPINSDQVSFKKPTEIIEAPKENIDQHSDIHLQSLKKSEIVNPPNMTFGRINPSPSQESNYLIYKKKQPKHKQLIHQPSFEPINSKQEKQNQEKFVLHQAICSNCEQDYGILGVRYLCLVCDNFNLCEECQKTVQHMHALLKIKTVQQIATKDQIAQKIKKDILCGPKPFIPNSNPAQSMSRDESNHYYLEIVQNYMKEGYEKSKRVFEEMITKLSGMKKNPNQFNNPNIQRPPYTKTCEEKAANIQSVINRDYYEILDMCKKNPSLSEQELINVYLTQRN